MKWLHHMHKGIPMKRKEVTSTICRFEARLKRTNANSPICASNTPTCECMQINHTDIHKQLLSREKQCGDFKYNP